ncbi:MAG: OmpH family outer membrane protein [bacterium]
MRTIIKTMLFTIAVAACFVVGMSLRGVSSAQSQAIRVATIDIEYVLNNFSETAAANQKLERLKLQREDELKNKITGQFGTADLSELDRKSQLEAERAVEDADRVFQAEAESLRAAEWDPAVEKVFDKIEKIASQGGFDIVLTKETVLYGGADITETVLRDLSVK